MWLVQEHLHINPIASGKDLTMDVLNKVHKRETNAWQKYRDPAKFGPRMARGKANTITTELTLYHTIPTFIDPEKEAFWKHWGKSRKCWQSAFSPFPTMFSTHSTKNFCFQVTFILSSVNAFNLDQFKNLSFGKELKRILPNAVVRYCI